MQYNVISHYMPVSKRLFSLREFPIRFSFNTTERWDVWHAYIKKVRLGLHLIAVPHGTVLPIDSFDDDPSIEAFQTTPFSQSENVLTVCSHSHPRLRQISDPCVSRLPSSKIFLPPRAQSYIPILFLSASWLALSVQTLPALRFRFDWPLSASQLALRLRVFAVGIYGSKRARLWCAYARDFPEFHQIAEIGFLDRQWPNIKMRRVRDTVLVVLGR